MNEFYEVIGIRIGEFTTRDTGEKKVYARVYATFNEDDGHTVGKACEVFKVSPEFVTNLQVGSSVVPVYNKYGRVAGFNVFSD